jgi:RNA polymerase sigma factor (TIGR02999 family)
MSSVTRILNQIEQGDPAASGELLPLVYEELRALARARLANEKPGQTLQATALVHEAYIRLVGKDNDQSWDNRGHFFAAAAEAMRRILINRARDKNRLKRNAVRRHIDIGGLQSPLLAPAEDLIDLDAAIQELEGQDSLLADLVKLRFYAGLSHVEAANCLKLPKSTADRYWSLARAWLAKRLESGSTSSD